MTRNCFAPSPNNAAKPTMQQYCSASLRFSRSHPRPAHSFAMLLPPAAGPCSCPYFLLPDLSDSQYFIRPQQNYTVSHQMILVPS